VAHVLALGYKASAEQFSPTELLELAVLAESMGLDLVGVSDHYQPWRHTGGHSPAVLPWLGALGQRTRRVHMGTSVLTPTLRYRPAVIAQAFATLACLYPGRIFLGAGTGEAMNETPTTGREWPSAKERRQRLTEAIELMRRLWTEERVTFEGRYYRTELATVYDRPPEPIPILVAASGPLAAGLAGQLGDGLICTSGKRRELYHDLIDAVEEGARTAGRDPASISRMIEIKVSYDHDADYAREACRWWAGLSLTTEEKSGVDDPVQLERLADAAADRAHTRFIVSDDPTEVAERIGAYVELGFTHLLFHAPGSDQRRFLEQFCADVVPRLRALG
jgi:coenzyme F420-dependent glucose-6-phosphate dehydrogenase